MSAADAAKIFRFGLFWIISPSFQSPEPHQERSCKSWGVLCLGFQKVSPAPDVDQYCQCFIRKTKMCHYCFTEMYWIYVTMTSDAARLKWIPASDSFSIKLPLFFLSVCLTLSLGALTQTGSSGHLVFWASICRPPIRYDEALFKQLICQMSYFH